MNRAFAAFTRSKNFHFDTLQTSAWLIFGKSFGFLAQLLIAYFFGVNQQTDHFFFAFSVLIYFTIALGEAPKKVLVLFVAEKSAGEEGSHEFLNSILCWGGLFLAVTLAALTAAMPFLLRMTGLYDEPAISAVMRHFFLGWPMVFLVCAASWLSGLLDYHKRFWISAGLPALRSVTAVAVLYLLRNRCGVYSVMLGYVAGEALLFFFTALAARRILGFLPRWQPGDPALLAPFISTAGFFAAASALGALGPITDRLVASWVGVGNLSLLQYSSTLVYTLHGVFIAGFETVLITYWSEAYHSGKNLPALRGDFMRRTAESLLVTVPVCLVCWFFRAGIARLAFLHGSFPPAAVGELGDAFGLQVFALIPLPVLIALTHYFIVIRRTRILLTAAVLRIALAVSLDLSLASALGVRGIALSVSIQTLLIVLFLTIFFARSARTRQTS